MKAVFNLTYLTGATDVAVGFGFQSDDLQSFARFFFFGGPFLISAGIITARAGTETKIKEVFRLRYDRRMGIKNNIRRTKTIHRSKLAYIFRCTVPPSNFPSSPLQYSSESSSPSE